MVQQAPCGEWVSPISSALVAGKTVGLSEPRISPTGQVFWLESRPLENGRTVLVTSGPSTVSTVSPPVQSGVNVKTRVQEYGGGSYLLVGDVVYFSNCSDQRLYKQSLSEPSAAQPTPVTAADTKLRFAEAVWDAPRARIICVTEDHSGAGEAVNAISAVDAASGTVTTLAGGCDFFSSPALNPSCTKLSWVQWSHPNMPWDGTELWVGDISPSGEVENKKKVAGGTDEAVQQPRWGPDGSLYFVSDPTGWWNLYRLSPQGETEALYPTESESAIVPWTLGRSSYALLPDGRLLVIHKKLETPGNTLSVLEPGSKQMSPINTGFASFGVWLPCVQLQGSSKFKVALVCGSPSNNSRVVSLEVESTEQLLSSSPQDWQTLQTASDVEVDPRYISHPQTIAFPTSGGEVAYMYYYPPTNPDFVPREGELPPLLVKSHGGPTSSASVDLNLGRQYFTSRGYAIADIDYRGSTGYGRLYRNKLRGQWGVVDVDDCTHAALHLAREGRVDGSRCCISGSSAGGYTTLCCLAFRDAFKVGASVYGVADLELLAKDTHKFESRYLDLLVGPYPASLALYQERSPLHHVDGCNCPIIFFQGSEDQVVPPNQAEEMHAAVKAKGLATALVMFEGERHGFCKADSIQRALDGELYFYGRVLGFNPPMPEDFVPIQVDNM